MKLSDYPFTAGVVTARNFADAWSRGEPYTKALLIVGTTGNESVLARAVAEAHGWFLVDVSGKPKSIVADALTIGSLGVDRKAVLLTDVAAMPIGERRALAKAINDALCPVLLTADSPHNLGADLTRAVPIVALLEGPVDGGGTPAPIGSDQPLSARLRGLRAGQEARIAPSEYGQVSWQLLSDQRLGAAERFDRLWARYRRVGKVVEPWMLRTLRR